MILKNNIVISQNNTTVVKSQNMSDQSKKATIKYGVYSPTQAERAGIVKWETPSGDTVSCTEVSSNPYFKSCFSDAGKLVEVTKWVSRISNGKRNGGKRY